MADAYICRRGGSGSGGGFDLIIVGGTTSPAKATHNMIWLNTPNEITSCALTATEPDAPVEGMAWITIGASGAVKMASPVGDDWITVYPISAKQYVAGVWVDVTAMSYQNGAWVEWITWLYKDGERFVNLTGVIEKFYTSYGTPVFTYNETSMLFTSPGNGVYGFVNQLDLSGKSKLCCEYKVTGSGTYDCSVVVLSTKTITGMSDGAVARGTCMKDNAIHVMEIDISTINSGYIGFTGAINSSASFNFTIYKLWLE